MILSLNILIGKEGLSIIKVDPYPEILKTLVSMPPTQEDTRVPSCSKTVGKADVIKFNA